MEILAKRLVELRTMKRVSRKEVAVRTGISERTYQRYENNERDPDAPILKKLSDYYDVSADYLLGRTDIPK